MTPSPRVLELTAGARYPAVWLRDNCSCGECVDPGSGQKLYGITDVPPEIRIRTVEETEAAVTVEFAPDGHRSTFSRAWLAEHRLGEQAPADDRAEDAKQLWQAADLADSMPTAEWPAFHQDRSERAAGLEALRRLGFVLLRGVPTSERAVLDVAGSFGHVRRTNYGELFEVRVEEQPTNLAFSSLPITPHTDNPYRDPVPTIQLLHCLVNAAEGGDSGLVDGFAAAAQLRAEDPTAFETLAGTPVTFRYADSTTELTATRPLIGVDPIGRIREVRFNNRSMRPTALPVERIEGFYAAYRRFAELLYSEAAQLSFRLDPGDCLVFDNTRVLHARTGFRASGHRHLQGCYADLDGAYSHFNVLRR